MLNNKIFRNLATALTVLLTTLVVGVGGFYYIEDLTFVDALYMTVITMSTVGFETLEGGLSPEGKVFTVLLIVSTIGTFTYAITTVTTLVVEGEMQKLVKGYRVNKEINKLENHIIICGLGRNGNQAAKELEVEGIPYVIIEMNEEVVTRHMQQNPQSLVFLGDATDEEVLNKVHIKRARGVISALADDADNVYVTLTIRQINPTVQVVARASNESTISKLKVAGANRVILPNLLGGRKMAKIITKPALMDFVDMITGQGQSHLHLEQIDCESRQSLVGKTLRELDIRSKTGVLVLGTQDGEGNFQLNPNVNKVITRNERLFVIGTSDQMQDFEREYS
ncbi:MAG: potassium channel protein [Bacteroidota bacterium]